MVNEKDTVIKIGRYGIYMQHGDKNYNINDDFEPSNLNEQTIIELVNQKEEEPEKIATNPDTGEPVILKNGRYGRYLQSGAKIKSIPKGIEDLTEEIAEKIIKFPIDLGQANSASHLLQIWLRVDLSFLLIFQNCSLKYHEEYHYEQIH